MQSKSSFTLMCARKRCSGKSATALKIDDFPKGSLIKPSHARDEASVTAVGLRSWCVASYQDVPLQLCQTYIHIYIFIYISISCRRPPLASTSINARILFPSVWRDEAMWRYMCHVYKLAGGTATAMLVRFPTSFSKVAKEM